MSRSCRRTFPMSGVVSRQMTPPGRQPAGRLEFRIRPHRMRYSRDMSPSPAIELATDLGEGAVHEVARLLSRYSRLVFRLAVPLPGERLRDHGDFIAGNP